MKLMISGPFIRQQIVRNTSGGLNLLLIVLLASLSVLSSCIKEDVNTGAGVPNVFMPVELLRSVYKNADVQLTEDVMMGAHSINGVVISDTASGNFLPGELIVQNYGRGAVRGVKIVMENGVKSPVSIGDSIAINIVGATLTNAGGGFRITGVKAAAITRLATQVPVIAQEISLSSLSTSFSTYEATLLKLTVDIEHTGADETYSGNKRLNASAGLGVALQTLPSAVFANETLPDRATLTAVATWATTDTGIVKSLSIRALSDVVPIESITLVGWQFSVPSSLGTEASYNATTVAEHLDQPSLTRGSGYLPAALQRGFSSTGKIIIATKNDALVNDGYYEFKIAVQPGYTVSLDALQSKLRRSAAGANTYRWSYRLNDTDAFTEIGAADIPFTGADAEGKDQPIVNLAAVSGLQKVSSAHPITLRLYGWGFGTLTGTFALARYPAGVASNCLTVTGIVDKE